MIIGAGDMGLTILKELGATAFSRGKPVIFVDDDPMKGGRRIEGIPVKGGCENIPELAKKYNGEDSPHGIMLALFPDTCQLCTKEKFLPYIREALGIKRGGNLSASSLEVLAVVAYNQPVTRSFVDQVRGVDSSYAVSSLIDKGLIESCGRLDAPGRPMLYATSDKFLRVFGFNSLDDLPKTEPLVVPDEAPSPEESTEVEE
jgi:segregation and condensation protein B